MSFGSSATRSSSTQGIFHSFGALQEKLSDYLGVRHFPTPDDFGAVGDNVTDDTTAIGLWLDYLIANDLEGFLPDKVYLCDYISKAVANGIRIRGSGTIKATGSNRLGMIRFTQARGKVQIDGLTFDGNDIAARPLEIQNTSSTASTLGEVWISPTTKVINAKNNAPDTYTATGCYILGGFEVVVFGGEIDQVDSSSTSGASSAGLVVTWSALASDDWCRHTVIMSSAKIRNVKNSNTVVADCDGLQVFAPTGVVAYLTVSPGALFDECKGRSIKSQVVGNAIDAPSIKRTLYDGLSEINLQYAGGHVRGAKVLHDGVRVNNVISVTQRTSPANTHCGISENELTVIGAPASDTGAMVATDVTDASVKLQGVTVRDNKVKGAVDTMVSCRVANVVDVNRIVIDGNWAETVSTAFLQTSLYGSARAQLSVVFTNNGCENGCAGADITDDLIVEYEANNHGISSLLNDPYTLTIQSGSITAFADAGGGDVTVASAAHGLLDGEVAHITGTTNYNGTYTISNVTTNTFDITATWVSDDATGTIEGWIRPYGQVHRVNTEGSAASDNLYVIQPSNRSHGEVLMLYANNDARTVSFQDDGNLKLSAAFDLDNTEDVIVLAPNPANKTYRQINGSNNGA